MYDVFYDFSLIVKVFINIHEYTNYLICIFDHGIKGLCLRFNLIPSLLGYNK